MKFHFSAILLLVICSLTIICLSSCSNDDKDPDTVSVKINGVVEKGPFVEGSIVSIFEMDKNLNSTGKVFKSETNKEGHFNINASEKLLSNIVEVSVTGYYFNEITGSRSVGTLTLGALASIDESNSDAKMNVNILTHLEMPRVLKLIKEEGKSFSEAKKQAQKELLSAFLITDQALTPEAVSITDNNTQADILIAISSIILNHSESDADMTAFMSSLRNDLLDGVVSAEMTAKIQAASYQLNYEKVAENITAHYNDVLKKDIQIGNFQYFIDGDGDGEIGSDYDVPTDILTPEETFLSEEYVLIAMTASIMNTCISQKYRNAFDALFTNTIPKPNFGYDLDDVYNHRLTPANGYIYTMWAQAYKSIQYYNNILKGLGGVAKPEFDKYKYMALTLRSLEYLSMVQLWGGVPLVTENMSTGDIMYIDRTSQAEILNQLVSDLTIAQQHLPETGSEHVSSKYLASALLARVHLYKGEYDKALQYAGAVINSGKFSLNADYNAIFTAGSSEAIYTIPFSTSSNDEYITDLAKKGNYIPLARLAEVILTATEANMQLGRTQQATDLLNQLRARNSRATLNPGATKEAIQQALLEEWKEDLINEGHWFFALKRFDLSEQTLGIQSYMNLLPIPRREIDMNPGITQNPGYIN